MRKIEMYLMSALVTSLFVACDADTVDNVSFEVNLRNDAQEIYVGDDVTFDLVGNPDYIIFYSGTDGNKYANKDRLKVEVEAMSFSYTIKQQYTETAYQNRATMHIYLSEDFKGAYTVEGVAQATWTELSGVEEGDLKVPTCPGTRTETIQDEGDFTGYKDTKFYLAFRYETPVADVQQPRVDVTPLTLSKTVEGQTVTMSNPAKEFGFHYVFLKGKTQNNYGADDSKLLFQPQNTLDVEVDVWAISQQLDPSAVAPDEGTPIKSLDMTSTSYTYKYLVPGEYTVTFVARNANMWNTESVVREIKVVVKDK